MSSEQIQTLADFIHPMMSADEVLDVAAREGIALEPDGLMIMYRGADPDDIPCMIILNGTNVVETVQFTNQPLFDVMIDGVTMGMSRQDFLTSHPEATLVEKDTPPGAQSPLSHVVGRNGVRRTVIVIPKPQGTAPAGEAPEIYTLGPSSELWTEATITRGHVTSIRRKADPGHVYRTRGKDLEAIQKAAENQALKTGWAAREHGWPMDLNMDDRLRDWASSYTSFTSGPDGWSALAEWLITKSTPEQRHLFVEAYNWDHGFVPLTWIASAPTTELATVLEMFWACDPWYCEHEWAENGCVPSYHEAMFDFIYGVKQRIDAGYYGQRKGVLSRFRQPIAFRPSADVLEDGQSDHSQKRLFSPIMFAPIAGRDIGDLTPDWPIEIN